MKAINLLLLTCLFILGCTSDEKDWEIVKSENTIPAYLQFAQKYPESSMVKQAYKRIGQLKKDSIDASVFTVELSNIELHGVPQIEIVIGGREVYIEPEQRRKDSLEALNAIIRGRKKVKGSYLYMDHNDSLWIFHTSKKTISPESIWAGGSKNSETTYRVVGRTLHPKQKKISQKELIKRLDAVVIAKNKLFASLTESEKQLALSDSLEQVLLGRNDFQGDTYSKLETYNLLDYEHLRLLEYFEFLHDCRISNKEKEITTVFADTIVLTGTTENIWVFKERN